MACVSLTALSELSPAPEAKGGPSPLRNTLRQNAYLLFGIVGFMWLVEIIDFLTPSSSLDRFGIIARESEGLWGILFAPFWHGDWWHLVNNSIPFIVLGGLTLLSGRARFLEVCIIAGLCSGLGTWFFAQPNSLHIGASGVVFGLLGFLLLRAWFGRRIGWILIALLAAFLYGGLVFTLFRHQAGISWQGHFFGFLGGVLAARLHVNSETARDRKSAET